MKTILSSAVASSVLLLAAGPAAASCGAAFCTVNTDWQAQGTWGGAGAKFDLRYEFVDQDRPMAGSDRVSVGQVSRHHDEVSTLNRNVVLGFSYNTLAGWGINVQMPWVSRSHYHVHNHHGAKIAQRWNIDGPGDARITFNLPLTKQDNLNLLLGLKLPTGRSTVTNNDNALAERTLQPGTGSTDTLLGLAYHSTPNAGPHGWFAQAMWQHATAVRNSYRPGDQVGIDLGWRYAFNHDFSATVQANWQIRARDEGRNAEPADSGSRFLKLSPGLVYALDRDTQLYGFVQLPVYSHVNGVQLTSGKNIALGISRRF
ncbi:MAG: transporter [Pseudomonadota bacterium]